MRKNLGSPYYSARGPAVIDSFGFNFQGVNLKLPVGELDHQILGDGLHIDSERAWYTVPNQVCNARIDYQNRFGDEIFETRTGETKYDCQWGGFAGDEIKDFDVRPGQQCARLFVNGEFRGEQCHSVDP